MFHIWANLQSGSSLVFRVASVALAPVESAYVTGVRRRLSRARTRIQRLPLPVVSVGNLCVGGSGKTAFVQWIAGALKNRGITTGIVFRGYRSRTHKPRMVTRSDALEFGDEPALLHRLGFPVAVGRDRVAAARKLINGSASQPDCLILDDGFQYVSLYREVNILLYDVSHGLWVRCLPRGPLREPLSSVSRATVLILSRARSAPSGTLETFEQVFRKNLFGGPIFRMDIYGVPETEPSEPALYVVGTGNPESVVHSLQWSGKVIPLIFPDHERYGTGTVREIRRAVLTHRARSILTTRKDGIKLEGLDLGAPIIPVNTTLVLDDEESLIRMILDKIQTSGSRDGSALTRPVSE
ncbi:MAG: tetraacyldisaccharide 4'-kinase [bacterium JZ-2024 1]